MRPAVQRYQVSPQPSAAADDIVVPIGGTLADRIRALQSHASRARQQG